MSAEAYFPAGAYYDSRAPWNEDIDYDDEEEETDEDDSFDVFDDEE